MSVFLSDTMTDTAGTNLTSHTPEVGGAYAMDSIAGGTSPVISDANRARAGAGGYGYELILNAATPGTAGYDVEADLTVLSNPTDTAVMLFAHGDNLTGGYRAGWDGFSGAWNIAKGFGGSGILDAGTSATLTVSQTYHVKFTVRVSGSTSTLTLFVDSVQKSTITDTTYPTTGKAGFQIVVGTASNAYGVHLDNLVATDLSSSAGSDTARQNLPPCLLAF